MTKINNKNKINMRSDFYISKVLNNAISYKETNEKTKNSNKD